MILFLTSSPGGMIRENGQVRACELCRENDFVKNLRRYWRDDSKVLFIAAYPDSFEKNDVNGKLFEESLPLSGLGISKVDIMDNRELGFRPGDYDVVILSGGHVPTQNAFFHKVGLKEKLLDFDGILIGISAGTMNSAEVVYAQPEENGEAVDPDYKRFIPGLGLTELMIVPHYQFWKNDTLDDLRLLEDITYPDSMGRKIYLLTDGSYVLVEAGKSIVYGEAYLAENGILSQVSREGEHHEL